MALFCLPDQAFLSFKRKTVFQDIFRRDPAFLWKLLLPFYAPLHLRPATERFCFLLYLLSRALARKKNDAPRRQHLLLSEDKVEGIVIHSGTRHFSTSADTFTKISLVKKTKCFFADDIQIQRRVIFTCTWRIFMKCNIQLPVNRWWLFAAIEVFNISAAALACSLHWGKKAPTCTMK